MEEKAILRGRALALRDGIPEEDRESWSHRITERICRSEQWQRAKIVLSYASFRSEVDTGPVNRRALEEGKKLYLPRIFPSVRRMEFYRVRELDSLEKGYQGIREPQADEAGIFCPVDIPGEKVLMLMPGAAFDEKKNRIGYGGGYYDRYLERWKEYIGTKMLLAFSCQRVEEIAAEETDVAPDVIITELEG